MNEVREHLIKNAGEMVGRQYDYLVDANFLPAEIKAPIGIVIVSGETFNVEVTFKLR